jgi:hypothetical protein
MPDPLYDNSSTPDTSDADTLSSQSSRISNSLNKNDNSLKETQDFEDVLYSYVSTEKFKLKPPRQSVPLETFIKIIETDINSFQPKSLHYNNQDHRNKLLTTSKTEPELILLLNLPIRALLLS